VIAPAGHGKTTLLAQHAAVHRGHLAWHRATPEDAEPDQLLVSLHRALRRAGVGEGQPEGLDGLVRDLDGQGGQSTTIVLDDAHLLVDSRGEAALERLLTDGPRTLRTILASRRMPGLNLCRAELGPVAVITPDDLRFRSWEVEELFRDVYGEALPPDDIAALTRRTDGWAACLQLFHLSTQFRSLAERKRAVAALSGGARFARSYLARTVLDELPRELGEFLARTAVFEVLTADRCDRLLDRSGAQRQLEELERLGVLTTSDDQGRSFRYHEVLRRHLESALREQYGPAQTAEWYARAAEILEAEGAAGEAVRACLRGEQWDRATRLLRRAGSRAIDVGPGPLWDDVLPPDLVDEDPWLSTAVARRLAADGQLSAAADRYRRAEALFPDPGDRERTARERRLVELWTVGLPQPHLHWMDQVRAAVARHPAGQATAHASVPGHQLATALSALLAGDVAAAGRCLQSLLDNGVGDDAGPASSSTGLLALSTRLAHALVALAAGASIAHEVDHIAADADLLGAAWFARQARVLHGLQLGDEAELARVGHECRASGDVWGELLAQGATAFTGLAAGSPSSAVFLDLAERCADLGAGSLRAWALAGAALGAADRQETGAAALARAAEAAGRSAGVWGTQVLTSLAASATAADPRGAVLRARAAARDHGLPWPEGLAQRLALSSVSPAAGLPAVRVVEPDAEPVRLRCLGAFELEMGGSVVDWSSVRPKAASAFRLLAVHTPDAVHREMLLQLWPGLPDGQATHSLQVAVSSLRNLLVPDAPRGGARMLERRGESYVLVLPPGSTADVVRLRDDLAAGERARVAGRPSAEREALARAVSVYRGDLLPDDGSADWVVPERDRLRLRAAGACARLAELHVRSGELDESVSAARRGLEIDPFADAAWRMLIRACDRLGDSAAAARARRDYADMLRDLGVPLPRTVRPSAG
jgi:DNA-binding SARP family transcriptional activator